MRTNNCAPTFAPRHFRANICAATFLRRHLRADNYYVITTRQCIPPIISVHISARKCRRICRLLKGRVRKCRCAYVEAQKSPTRWKTPNTLDLQHKKRRKSFKIFKFCNFALNYFRFNLYVAWFNKKLRGSQKKSSTIKTLKSCMRWKTLVSAKILIKTEILLICAGKHFSVQNFRQKIWNFASCTENHF